MWKIKIIIEILLLIILFGLTINFRQIKKVIFSILFIYSDLKARNMLISSMYFNKWDYKYYQMLGRDIIVVYLHMGKQAQENHILWLVMEQIKYI